MTERYTYLTGRPYFPPKWAFGYQQCRYSYYPDEQVLDIARQFRKREIPCDVMHLDLHYMQDSQMFTWDKEGFSDPAGLDKQLEDMGFKSVVNLKPWVNTPADVQEAVDKKLTFTWPNSKPFLYNEGKNTYIDFTKPAARDWWGQKYKAYTDAGVDGFWNDANEAAISNGVPEILRCDWEGRQSNHRKSLNVYGTLNAKATYEGVDKLWGGNKRVFSLTRSGSPGMQRYAGTWTGDVTSDEANIVYGIILMNSLGLSGVPYVGADAGGFFEDTDRNLYTRWVQQASFTPFFRVHTNNKNRFTEPFVMGEEVEATVKRYIELRYRLFPYVYSQFRESTQTGMPLMRAGFLEFPQEDAFYKKYQLQYFFGQDLMVAYSNIDQKVTKVMLPEDQGM